MITQDLGIATAYGYAKSKGYTGTEAEFAELMASYASTAQTAIEAADRAVEANTAAQSAKTDAQASKTAAQTAAQTATTKASEASQSASTATTKASEASTSADTASTAAQTATDKASEATTAATTATTKASEASESATTATTAKTDAETARDAAAQSASEAAASAESIDPDEFDRKIYAAFATDTATGDIASFADGADNIPMKDVLVHIEPVQAGSGDPSPDNVRPITGWTGAKVTRTGKNLLRLVKSEMISGGWNRIFPISLKAGTYVMSCQNQFGATTAYGSQVFLADANDNAVKLLYPGYTFGDTVFVTNPVTITEEEAQRIKLIRFNLRAGNVTFENIFAGNIQLELGSTATAYEPYSGQTYSITFPSSAGTVYGGTLDVTKGELVVDRAMVDLGAINYSRTSGYDGTFVFTTGGFAGIKAGIANIISDCFLTTTITSWTDSKPNNSICGSATGTTVVIRADSYENVDDLKTALNGHHAVYELGTPIHYPITPQEITSLLGQNNLWADTGNSEVEYRADTNLYITKKITEAVSALS